MIYTFQYKYRFMSMHVQCFIKLQLINDITTQVTHKSAMTFSDFVSPVMQ